MSIIVGIIAKAGSNNVTIRRIDNVIALLFVAIFSLPACTTASKHTDKEEQKIFVAEKGKEVISTYAPVLVIENASQPYNLPGTPSARMNDDNNEEIYVDPTQPSIYFEKRFFTTNRGEYTNLVYRVHFEKVPKNHLTAGKNVGLLIIVTLNNDNEPLLYTSVHTCGCYIAFVPTSYLPKKMFPKEWTLERQSVFGESLPGILDYGDNSFETTKTLVLFRDATHRIGNFSLETQKQFDKRENNITAKLLPMDNLKQLPLGNGKTTSFFEHSGSRKGYVKMSHKPWERLFMSWWALDWRIGEDKMLGKDKLDGIVFYTSLKPWARDDSDLRDFANFLEYWGWNL